MMDLIEIHNQGTDLLADSRQVAALFGIHHKNLRVLIEENREAMEQLGVWRFETDKPHSTKTGGRPEKYYWLNFDQIAYLLTLTRATDRTKEFRLRLIIAFRDARAKLRPVDPLLLSIPEKWKKAFKDDFYIALLGLYGEKFEASKNKPSWVGGFTNRFIYEPIYHELPGELRNKRKKYAIATGKDPDYLKLHQFLEEHAKDELRQQITKITTLLQLAGSKMDFTESFRKLFGGEDQLRFSMPDLDDWK